MAGQAIVTSEQSTRDRRLPGVLLILTAVTGVVDAVSILALAAGLLTLAFCGAVAAARLR